MKFLAKILTAIGALAGVLYLIQKAISWAYENAVHRYVVFEQDGDDPDQDYKPQP